MEGNVLVNALIKERTITRKSIFLCFKRFSDIIISIIGFVFLIPVLLIVKICYMCTGDFKSIIFKHKRIGRNEKVFSMYKIRTMVPNAEEKLKEILKDPKMKKEWNENHKLDNDPRVTKLGKILRKASIDELPQFINVFKGDMSFIGPRPMIQEEVDDYKKNKSKLLSMKPGITGWWACNGRSNIEPEERKRLELYYIDNCSVLLDIKIILKTIIKVIKKEGAK